MEFINAHPISRRADGDYGHIYLQAERLVYLFDVDDAFEILATAENAHKCF